MPVTHIFLPNAIWLFTFSVNSQLETHEAIASASSPSCSATALIPAVSGRPEYAKRAFLNAKNASSPQILPAHSVACAASGTKIGNAAYAIFTSSPYFSETEVSVPSLLSLLQ